MIVYDIETKVLNNTIDPNTDIFRTIALYDIKKDKYYFFTENDIEHIKNVFKQHKVVIGHNNTEYDNVVLKRYGIDLRHHLVIDTLVIARKREQFLRIKDKSKSLSNLAKFFKLEHYKDDDFDYEVLNKDKFTQKDLDYIKTYNINDVKVTYELFKHFHDYFEPFKEYLSDYNNTRMTWLTSSIASFAYKAVCHMCNIKEEYSDNTENGTYEGGYVTEPIKEYSNNVVLFDFASLYPHVFSQCNLFSSQNDGWNNKKIGMKGYYSRTQGKIEKLLMNLYKKRSEYKKQGDRREYVIKIIINSIYGAAANPVFKNLYNKTSASDCTAISRYCIKTAIKTFKEFNYECLYTDTDSVYVALKDNQNIDMAKSVADLIIRNLQKEFLFPEKTFKLKVDDVIKHIYFFKKNDKYLKKTYMYVTQEDKLVIKGLPMIKSDGSKIGLKVFNKHMKKRIINGNNDFKYFEIKNWLLEELEKDINVCARRFKTKKVDFYKNKSQLQAQISEKYGAGTHFLITNYLYGVGKGKKYCTLKEFEEQKLNVHSVDTSKFWSEMNLFLDDVPIIVKRRTLKMCNNQKTLAAWGGV